MLSPVMLYDVLRRRMRIVFVYLENTGGASEICANKLASISLGFRYI